MYKLAMVLIVGGVLLLVGYGFYFIIEQLLLEAHLIIKIGIIALLSGVVLGAIKLIIEKLRGADDEDVDRKY